MDYEDDPIIAAQAKLLEGKCKTKKAKVQREGKKFDSANHEKERQTGKTVSEETNEWFHYPIHFLTNSSSSMIILTWWLCFKKLKFRKIVNIYNLIVYECDRYRSCLFLTSYQLYFVQIFDKLKKR